MKQTTHPVLAWLKKLGKARILGGPSRTTLMKAFSEGTPVTFFLNDLKTKHRRAGLNLLKLTYFY